MNGYNFTERVRQVLAMAREEAAGLGHEYTGTEHMLLGLVREGQGVAASVLQYRSVELSEIRHRIMETLTRGRAAHTSGPDLPYTSRAKKVIELAMSEARELRHSYVGTEHLLLGMLREEKGVAAQVLKEAGITLEIARAETLRILGEDMTDRDLHPSSSGPLSPVFGRVTNETLRVAELRPANEIPQSITVELQYADGTVRRRKCADRLEAMRFLVQ